MQGSLRFILNQHTYRNYPDNREMDPHLFYEKLRAGEVATTAAVNVAEYVDAVEPLLQAGHDVLILAFSSGLSTTYNSSAIAVEQFGYGLGYMAHVLFMVQFANRSGKYKTSHFAFMTGIAILGMTLVGMFSGKMQELFARLSAQHGAEAGYRYFFLWICLCTVPSFLSVHFAGKHLDAGFGKNSPEPESR